MQMKSGTMQQKNAEEEWHNAEVECRRRRDNEKEEWNNTEGRVEQCSRRMLKKNGTIQQRSVPMQKESETNAE